MALFYGILATDILWHSRHTLAMASITQRFGERVKKLRTQRKMSLYKKNPKRIRDFLKKIGSNFRIAERTLSLPLKNAWILAVKYHAKALCAEATSFNFAECTNWRCLLDKVRMYFEQNPNDE